ncbi:hypothetical protein [Ensifer aridi]|uniref:hypothetical protein n=1 Tax=Ensifer aridi TaxID=1708715 RepID=UPI000A101711|nr:hypothetical protein [Ensifer aridi]
MSDPLPLSEIFDRLPIASVVWSIQRNDELSGVGSGTFWQAELAPVLWTAEVTLGRGLNDELKQAAALIRKLDGARQSFMLCDPVSVYPQADPKGTVLGAAQVTLGAIGSDRTVAPLQGLPAGYVLTIGDKLQIQSAGKTAFVEVSNTIAALAGGTANVSIFPRLPAWVAAGATVVLKRPACPVVIFPESHNPGTARRAVTEGAAFKVIQKK